MSHNDYKLKFIIPLNMVGVGGTGTSGRNTIPLYVNPTSLSFSEKKLISKTNTKGGFSVQYWGEELATIKIAGNTGSGGVEAIQILRSIYMNEQTQFKRLLRERSRTLRVDAEANILTDARAASRALADPTQSLKDGISTAIQLITDRSASSSSYQRVEQIPTLGSFFVSMDLYYLGETFRGYISDFLFSESSETIGLFVYDMNFTVLRKTGSRVNNMPWHRNPLDTSGDPREASDYSLGQDVDNLSISYGKSKLNIALNQNIKNNISTSILDKNVIDINRLKKS